LCAPKCVDRFEHDADQHDRSYSHGNDKQKPEKDFDFGVHFTSNPTPRFSRELIQLTKEAAYRESAASACSGAQGWPREPRASIQLFLLRSLTYRLSDSIAKLPQNGCD
jgi:hypothetical protein